MFDSMARGAERDHEVKSVAAGDHEREVKSVAAEALYNLYALSSLLCARDGNREGDSYVDQLTSLERRHTRRCSRRLLYALGRSSRFQHPSSFQQCKSELQVPNSKRRCRTMLAIKKIHYHFDAGCLDYV